MIGLLISAQITHEELPADQLGTAEDIDKLARRQVRVTKEHNEECKRLLALMGIPCITVGVGLKAVLMRRLLERQKRSARN